MGLESSSFPDIPGDSDASPSPSRTGLATGLVAALVVALLAALPSAPAYAANPVTPGNFTGLGFDQCDAPRQAAMTAWIKNSPFRRGGHLHLRQLPGLPHAVQPDPDLGAQPARRRLAPDADHARPAGVLLDALPALRQEHRPHDQPEHDEPATPRPGPRAAPRPRRPSRPRATSASSAGARSSTTSRRFSSGKTTACTTSAMWFLHSWTTQLHALGYASGFYSSAASGIKMLDDARVTAGNPIALPDQIWIADWNGKANTELLLHPQRRVAALRPREAVPRRAQGDLGRRDDQHRPQLPQPAHAEDRRRSTPAPAPAPAPASPKYTGTATRTPAARRRRSAGAGTSRPTPRPTRRLIVPLQCLLKQQRLYKYAVTGNGTGRRSGAARLPEARPATRCGPTSAATSGWPCSPAATAARRCRPGSRAPTSSGCSGPSTPPPLRRSRSRDLRRRHPQGRGRLPEGGRDRPSGIVGRATWAAFERGRR